MQVMPMINDHELIARYVDGDEQAFETLLHRYKAKIYTSIYLFVILPAPCAGTRELRSCSLWRRISTIFPETLRLAAQGDTTPSRSSYPKHPHRTNSLRPILPQFVMQTVKRHGHFPPSHRR